MEPTAALRRACTTVAVLFLALLATAMYAHSQARRAADAESALFASRRTQPPSVTTSSRYPAALIREDGTRTPLDGKALHVDLGGGKLVELDLRRQPTGHLRMWAPAKRDDDHVNVLVFHPYCANVFALELERIDRRSSAREGRAFDYGERYEDR